MVSFSEQLTGPGCHQWIKTFDKATLKAGWERILNTVKAAPMARPTPKSAAGAIMQRHLRLQRCDSADYFLKRHRQHKQTAVPLLVAMAPETDRSSSQSNQPPCTSVDTISNHPKSNSPESNNAAAELDLRHIFSNPKLHVPVAKPQPAPPEGHTARSAELDLRRIFSNTELHTPVSEAEAPPAELDLRRIFSNPSLHNPASVHSPAAVHVSTTSDGAMHTQDHRGGSTLWIDTAAAPYNQQPSGTGLSIYASSKQPAALNLTHRLRGGANLTTAPYEPQENVSALPGAPTTCAPPAAHTSARTILHRLVGANCATPTIFSQCTWSEVTDNKQQITTNQLENKDADLSVTVSLLRTAREAAQAEWISRQQQWNHRQLQLEAEVSTTRTELCNGNDQLGIRISNESTQAMTHTPSLLEAAPPELNDSDSQAHEGDWSVTYELPELIQRRSAAFRIDTMMASLSQQWSRQCASHGVNVNPAPAPSLLHVMQDLGQQIDKLSKEVETYAWEPHMEPALRIELQKVESGWLRGQSKRTAEIWLSSLDILREKKQEFTRLKRGLVYISLMQVIGQNDNVSELLMRSVIEHTQEELQMKQPNRICKAEIDRRED